MRDIAKWVTERPEYDVVVTSVARRQMKRRRMAYEAVSLFEWTDLRNQLFLEMMVRDRLGRVLVAFTDTTDSFKEYVQTLAEVIANRGRRRLGVAKVLRLSQLSRRDRFKIFHSHGMELEITFDELFERPEYWG